MYEVIQNVIDAPADGDTKIIAICAVGAIVFVCVMIDMIRDIFSGFFRG